jgi:chemotaxis response regulator CheB
LRRTALKLRPDVILLRFEIATAEGFQAVKEIFQCLPRARIVFMPTPANVTPLMQRLRGE